MSAKPGAPAPSLNEMGHPRLEMVRRQITIAPVSKTRGANHFVPPPARFPEQGHESDAMASVNKA